MEKCKDNNIWSIYGNMVMFELSSFLHYSSIQAFNKELSLIQTTPKLNKQETKTWTENIIPHLEVNKWGTERDPKENCGQPQNLFFLPDVVRKSLWHRPITLSKQMSNVNAVPDGQSAGPAPEACLHSAQMQFCCCLDFLCSFKLWPCGFPPGTNALKCSISRAKWSELNPFSKLEE